MSSFISINWRGRPLVSHQVVVQHRPAVRPLSRGAMGPDAPPTRLHSELTQTDPDGRIDGVRAPA
jgi:hypothetical protein